MTALRGVVAAYPHTQALLDEPVALADGARVAFATPDRAGGAVGSMSRMLRPEAGLDFDVCELPLVSYVAARAQGLALTAIPVVLTRRFPHRTLIGNRRLGVEAPADLEGRRVGIGYHGNTDVTWARALLARDHGVDLARVTWVTAFEEQVAGAPVPANAIHLPRVDLAQMLDAGELAGLIAGNAPPPEADHLALLVADPEAGERDWRERLGGAPPLHVVVVKERVAAAHPTIARDLLDRFARAKADRLAALAAGEALEGAAVRQALTSGFPLAAAGPGEPADPLPYGIEANRTALEALLAACVEQRLLATAPALEELFPPIAG